jgi:hypothetical protein
VTALELYHASIGSARTIKPEELPLILNSAIATMFFHAADPLAYMALKPRVTFMQRKATNSALWFISLFILGHEAGHILLNHFEETPKRQAKFRSHSGVKTVEVFQPAHAEEFAADQFASEVLFEGEERGELRKADSDRAQYWSACYGQLGFVFSVLGAVERMSTRIGLALGDTHPPASERWEKIAEFLRARAPVVDLIIRVDEKLRGIVLAAAESGPMPPISEEALHESVGFVGLPLSWLEELGHQDDKEPERMRAVEVLGLWLFSPTPEVAKEVVLTFPEVLDPKMEAMHYLCAKGEPDESLRRDILVNKLLILRRCKEIGIEAAFNELKAKKLGVRTKPLPVFHASGSVERRVLEKVEEAVKKFVNANTAEETETIFDSHPELQHPSADLFLEEFAAEQPNNSAKTRVEAARIILAYSKKFTIFRAILEARAALRF